MRVSILLALFALGCVPKGKYDELLAAKVDVEQKLDAASLTLDDLGKTIQRKSAEIDTLNKALDEANRKLAAKAREAGALKEDLDEMRIALNELEVRKARAEASLSAYRDLVNKFQRLIDAGTLKVKVVDGRMVVELATDILFPPGSAYLSRDGQRAIAEVGSVLASIPGREFQVAGHTDDQPIATAQFPSNWHLGAARAIAVTRLLVKGGLTADRVSAASYAEFRPAATNRTTEGRGANRRIEIIIVPDLSELPGYEELKELSSKDP